ncbi:MAG: DUF3098 domain-containing protein [Chlorobi bacterium]|nr:DUF3098 domain-containing protein [Chlorobiota bacterium]
MKRQPAKKRPAAKRSSAPQASLLFGKENYKWMLIGLALIALGFILMAGGGSKNPEVFNPDIFSFRRIRLAPFLVLLGFAVEIYAIMRGPRK